MRPQRTITLICGKIFTPDGLDLSLLKDTVAFGRKTAEMAGWALLWETARRYNATYHVPPNGRWVFLKQDHCKAEAEMFAQTILREWSGSGFSWLPEVKVDAYTHAPPRVGPVSDSTVGCMPWIKGVPAKHVYKRWCFTQNSIWDGQDFARSESYIRSLIPEEKRAGYCGPVFVTGIVPWDLQVSYRLIGPSTPPSQTEEPSTAEEVPTGCTHEELVQRLLEIDRQHARKLVEVDKLWRAKEKQRVIRFQKFLREPPPRFVIGDRVSQKESLQVETANVSTMLMVQPPVVPKGEHIARSHERTPMSVGSEGMSVHSAARRAARAFFRGQIQATDSILSPPSSVGSSSVRSSSVGSSSFGSSPGRNGARTFVFKNGDTSYGPKMVHGRPSLPETPPSTPESSNHSSPASHPRRPTVNKLRPKASADTLEITNA